MTDNPTYECSLPFGMQPSKAPAERASMDDHQFRLAPPMGNFLLSASTANLLDEKRFPFLRQFLPHPEQAVDLTLDEDEDDEDGEDATEVSWLMNLRIIPRLIALTPDSLIDRFPVVDYFSALRIPLLTDVIYSSHAWQEETPLEECPAVVAIVPQTSATFQRASFYPDR
jgi:hypothetical protein